MRMAVAINTTPMVRLYCQGHQHLVARQPLVQDVLAVVPQHLPHYITFPAPLEQPTDLVLAQLAVNTV